MRSDIPSVADSDAFFIRTAVEAGTRAARQVIDEFKSQIGGPPREWFTLQEAAEYLRLSEQHLCALIKQGTGPRSVKIGNGRRLRKAWCDDFILHREQNPDAPPGRPRKRTSAKEAGRA